MTHLSDPKTTEVWFHREKSGFTAMTTPVSAEQMHVKA